MIHLAFIYWDPNPVLFYLPFLHVPILWYGVLFALGFILGFPIFVGVLERFFLQRPDFEERDIKGECPHPKLIAGEKGKSQLVKALNAWLASDDPLEEPLPKRAARFAACSIHANLAVRRLKLEQMFADGILSLKRQAVVLTDKLTVYMVVATVLGARLGHFLFYENPSEYMRDPLEIFAIWKGGLASHGAAVAIVLALWLYARRYPVRQLSLLHLLDFVVVPTALAGALIRLGNFFNQEILGTVTDLPWAVVFGHAADHSLPAPRHPVQLYEAIAYGAIFYLLWKLSFRSKFLLNKGKLLGIFLILVFGFRFVVEFWKLEQSRLVSLPLTMGQILSIPAIFIGFFLVIRNQSKV